MTIHADTVGGVPVHEVIAMLGKNKKRQPDPPQYRGIRDNDAGDGDAPQRNTKPETEAAPAKLKRPSDGGVDLTAAGKKPVAGEVVNVNKRLSGLARTIKSQQKKATEAVLAVGAALTEARELLADHKGGSYGKWLKEVVGMNRMTAHRYTSFYDTWGTENFSCNTMLQLSDLDALRKLAGADSAVISKAKKLMEGGERLDMKTAKALLGSKPTKAKTGGKPDETIVEVEGLGFVVFKPRSDNVTPAEMVNALIRQMREHRERKAA